MLLVEGATAGGKTAVYAEALRAALAAGRGGMVLVPEIALAMPLLERLAHDLPVDVAVLHSGSAEGERADEWRRIRKGEARVVVGTRLAVLAPLADLGVVIVDEEHDAGLQVRPHAALPGARRRPGARPAGERAGDPGQRHAGRRERRPRSRRASIERFVLPERVAGGPPDRRDRRPAGRARPRAIGASCRERLVDALDDLDTVGR